MYSWLSSIVVVLLILVSVEGMRQRLKRYDHRTTTNRTVLSLPHVDVRERIIEFQCYDRCGLNITIECRESCQKELLWMPRRGHCPDIHDNTVTNSVSYHHHPKCLYSCQHDFDCTDVHKCCDTLCGTMCILPNDIQDDALLPSIPRIIKFEIKRNHKMILTVQSSGNYTYYMQVELRQHIGLHFSARKLSAWQWQPVELLADFYEKKSRRTKVTFNLRPSRFYQIRVAAVNSYGFRGYSESVTTNASKYDPKPPKAPADIKVASRQADGKFYNIRVVWCPSKSNLPVEKYKIIWSLYVTESKEESLISNETYVKDAHQYQITNLLRNSSYYIQVQAISFFGSRRLKSDKKSLVYTTLDMIPAYTPLQCSGNDAHNTARKSNFHRLHHEREHMPESITMPSVLPVVCNNSESQQGIISAKTTSFTTKMITSVAKMAEPSYKVRYRMNRKMGLLVQISGFTPNAEKIYELCPKETNCEQIEYSAIRPEINSLEFSKLKYNTTYMLKMVGDDSAGAFTFTTPKCENLRKRFPKLIKC